MIKRRVFSVAYMFGLTLLFSALVTLVYGVNRERIALNETLKLHRFVLKVLDVPLPQDADAREVARVYEHRIREVQTGGQTVYMALSQDGTRVEGVAFHLFGPGFWGPIYGLMGLSSDLTHVLGIAFYKHTETPGLGGRMTEPWFTNQFKGKRIPPKATGDKPFFRLKPPEQVHAENDVDAIAGATGTSRALERLLNSDLKHYLPLLAKALEQRKARADSG